MYHPLSLISPLLVASLAMTSQGHQLVSSPVQAVVVPTDLAKSGAVFVCHLALPAEVPQPSLPTLRHLGILLVTTSERGRQAAMAALLGEDG